MLLAIDIGNTNTVFAVYDGDTLYESWRCQTISTRSADEYAVFLNELFSLKTLGWESFHDVIISSVVPETSRHIRGFCKKYLAIKPIEITKEIVGIEIDLDKPDEVGADRLVNAIAVRAHYSVPAIVIDFGTATTFDVIDAQGRYGGGIIAPGINLSVRALHEAAARLPSITVERPAHVIGKDTVSAMQSGVFWGYISLIEGLVARIEKEMGGKPLVLATGGLAPLFAGHTPVISSVDNELTLKGLLEIYKTIKG